VNNTCLIDNGSDIIRVNSTLYSNGYAYLLIMSPATTFEGAHIPAQSMNLSLNPESRRRLAAALLEGLEGAK
jgi:hypothetical protein